MKNVLKSLIVLGAVIFLTNAVMAQEQVQNKAQVQPQNQNQVRVNWVDANGDGICDNFGTENQGAGRKAKMNGRKGKGTGTATDGQGTQGGFGDGSGIRPQDGTGFGRKGGLANGTGTCDGTGPRGGRRGQK